MSSPITLRLYRPDDLDALFNMDEACFEKPFRFDRRSMRRFAEARNAISLLAETEPDVLAGFIILHLERAGGQIIAYIITLDVAPDHRRAGIASRLIADAERRALDSGATSITLHVFTGNASAIRFYEQHGYTRLQTQRRFYGKENGLDLDAYVYARELSPP